MAGLAGGQRTAPRDQSGDDRLQHELHPELFDSPVYRIISESSSLKNSRFVSW